MVFPGAVSGCCACYLQFHTLRGRVRLQVAMHPHFLNIGPGAYRTFFTRHSREEEKKGEKRRKQGEKCGSFPKQTAG